MQNERYGIRLAEVFIDRKVLQVVEKGFDFITEAPVPTVSEINIEPEFFAEIISYEEFEKVYESDIYSDNIDFPKNLDNKG